MARIRTIKPEFATDGDMLNLTDSCALFYVLLWTQCDDEGKHRNDPKEIAAKLARWDAGKVRLFIRKLLAQGQLQLGVESGEHQGNVGLQSGWLRVVAWNNQKIDKPKQPKIKSEEIQWLDAESLHDYSSTPREESTQGSDQGSDRIKDQGSDHIREALPVSLPKKRIKPSDHELELRRAVWNAYSEEYRSRWHQDPVDNKKVRSQIVGLVQRVGSEAPDLARFYVRHNDSFFVKDCHPIGLLLMKCEGLLTQMRRDKPITTADVRRLEKQQQQIGLLEDLKAGNL